MRRTMRGFTLIEIVVALVLVGLLAALAGPNLAGSLVGSAKSLQNLSTAITLQSLMEQVVQYRQANSSLALDTVKTHAQSLVTTGYSVSSTKTGYCTLSGTTFVVNTGATSGNFYMLTLVNGSTGESLTTMFAAK